jgi:hypothetical protein
MWTKIELLGNLKIMTWKIIVPLLLLASNVTVNAQDAVETRSLDYDPDRLKIIPDKVFEIGVPLLLLIFVVQALLEFAKMRSETRLKMQMIERGVPESLLVETFKVSNMIAKLQPLKWFLFTFATSFALIIIHFSRAFLVNSSGYFAVGLILLLNSVAFAVYYTILSRRLR